MMKILKIGLIALLSLTLSNCSTYTVKKDMSKKGELTKTPKWYIKYKREDRKWMYETASSVSPDLELAIKKSTLLAKAKLADRINGKMNNQSSITISEAYKILNLDMNKKYSKDEVNKAYIKIQKKIHPDVSPETSRLSSIVNEAKDIVLKDIS